jgi:hypothetical protein
MEPFLLQIGQINRRCGFRTGNKTTHDFEIYQIYRTVDVLWSIKVLWNDIDAKDCRAGTLCYVVEAAKYITWYLLGCSN